MENKRCFRSSIVPGRKMITNQVAYYQAGIIENMSYLAEKTIADDSSILNDTHDNEEREWRKQGLTEKQIYHRLQDKKLQKLRNAENRLNKEKFGAKNFQELLNKHEYSQRESEGEEEATTEKFDVFAIPALPKYLSEKSMLGSPVSGSKGCGKPGLSCSTPKSANDVSMRSLRSLDISHVVAVDQLDPKKVNIQSKTILIPIVQNSESSSLQKTHTSQKDQNSESLIGTKANSSLQESHTIPNSPSQSQTCSPQKNFTISDSTLQKTHTVPDTSVQKTYIIPSSSPHKKQDDHQDQTEPLHEKDKETSLQESSNVDIERETSNSDTLVVGTGLGNTLLDSVRKDQENEVQKLLNNNGDGLQEISSSNDVHIPVVQNLLQGGKKKSATNKIGLQEREKRSNDSLMRSMIEVVDSPGAGFFKNARKKQRPIKTPTKMKVNRLSTESDKEKTIDMLSIAEEASMDNETNGSSFVDPVNGSKISPIREVNEPIDHSKSETTPKSRPPTTPGSSIREKARAQRILEPLACNSFVVNNEIRLISTPKHHFQKPTFSSLVKNRNVDSNALLESSRRERINLPRRDITILKEAVPASLDEGEDQDDGTQNYFESTSDKTNRPDDDMSSKFDEISSHSTSDINDDLREMTVRDVPSMEIDYDPVDYVERDNQYDNSDVNTEHNERDSVNAGPSTKQKSFRKKIGLLSDSFASGSAPGIERRSTRHNFGNDTIVDDTWQPDEAPKRRNNKGRNGKNMGMQLKKREIIEPSTPNDEVRRSKRTRVKPTRSWLGEKPVYVNSPSGGKRLTGVTDVIINDKRLCKYRTADLKLATEREQKEKALKKMKAAERRRQLAADQKRGRRLNESQEDINTDDEYED